MTDVLQPQLDFGPPAVSELAVDPMQAAIARGRAAAEAVLALEKRPDLADATPSDETRALYPSRRQVTTEVDEETPADTRTERQKVMDQVAAMKARNTQAAIARGEEPYDPEKQRQIDQANSAHFLNGQKVRARQRGARRR